MNFVANLTINIHSSYPTEDASASSPIFRTGTDRHSGSSDSKFMVSPPLLIDELGMEGVPPMMGNVALFTGPSGLVMASVLRTFDNVKGLGMEAAVWMSHTSLPRLLPVETSTRSRVFMIPGAKERYIVECCVRRCNIVCAAEVRRCVECVGGSDEWSRIDRTGNRS